MYHLSLFTNLFILTYDKNYVKGILEEFFLVVFLFYLIPWKNKIDAYMYF